MAKPVPKAASRSKAKIILLVLNIVVIAGLVATSAYFFKRYDNLKKEQSLTTEQRNEKTIAQINKVYQLPKGETPTFAVVTDEQKFKEQYPVFTDVKKDDVLLIYRDASLAVLYRPGENRVIATPTVKIPLGIQLIGQDSTAVAAVEKTLKEKVAGDAQVIAKTQGNTPQSTTIVVDVNGKKTDAAQQLAELLGGTVGKLPAGETANEGVDIVIVVGSSTEADSIQP